MLALWFTNDVPRCMRALHRNLQGSHRIICLFLLFYVSSFFFENIFNLRGIQWCSTSIKIPSGSVSTVRCSTSLAIRLYLCKAGFLVDAITKPKKRETGNEMQLSKYKKLCSAPKAYCDYTRNFNLCVFIFQLLGC